MISDQDEGMEWIRVERVGDSIHVVQKDQLQPKRQRTYYQESKLGTKDEVFFSEIELNREHGKIVEPWMPTLRCAKPLYDQGQFMGVLIINADLTGIFEDLARYSDVKHDFYLLNDQGHYLIHQDKDQTFGFEFGKASAVTNLPLEGSTDSVPVMKSETGRVFITKWPYPRDNYDLYAMMEVSNKVLFSSLNIWGRWTLGFVLIAIFIVGGLAIWLLRYQSDQLNRITYSMINWEGDELPPDLPVNREDEIGQLAITFQKIAQRIKSSLLQIRDERNKARKANRAKEEFIGGVSHEIRNPLQNILGMHQILESNNPREDQVPILNTLKFSTKQLVALVNDILDYSNIIEGGLILRPQNQSISALVKNIIRSYQFDARYKNIKIHLSIDSKYDRIGYDIDDLRFSQILGNLISNSIRHGREGNQVFVNVFSVDDQNVRFVVKDDGPGIDPLKLNKITSMIDKVKDLELGSYGTENSGIGLIICSALLNAMSSTLEVTSEVNRGAAFSFTLNLGKGVLLESRGHSVAPPSFDGIVSSILCIEDDPAIAHFLSHLFEPSHYRFKHIDNYHQILSEESESQYDLILCDVNLGDEVMTRKGMFLEKLLSIDGILIYVSGQKVELPYYGDHISQVLKPVTARSLFDNWFFSWKKYLRQDPSTDYIMAQYDHDLNKVNGAVLLISERWAILSNEFVKSLRYKDYKSVSKLGHQMVVLLKTLELNSVAHIVSKIMNASKAELEISSEIIALLSFEFGLIHDKVRDLKHLI